MDSQGWVAVDVGIKFPGAKYEALTSYTAHAATAQKELFYALLLVGTAETIGFTQIYNMMDGVDDRDAGDFGFDHDFEATASDCGHAPRAVVTMDVAALGCAAGDATFAAGLLTVFW